MLSKVRAYRNYWSVTCPPTLRMYQNVKLLNCKYLICLWLSLDMLWIIKIIYSLWYPRTAYHPMVQLWCYMKALIFGKSTCQSSSLSGSNNYWYGIPHPNPSCLSILPEYWWLLKTGNLSYWVTPVIFRICVVFWGVQGTLCLQHLWDVSK